MFHTIAGFGRIGEENAFAVLARATDLAAQGRDIVNLGIGQPDFRTPEHIVEAAIKALREGRDADLTREELQLAVHIRQVARGTVTPESYKAIEARFGVRGAVEFTGFIGHLLMTIRLIQAFGAQPTKEHQVNELIDKIIAGEVDLPSPKDRVPTLEAV